LTREEEYLRKYKELEPEGRNIPAVNAIIQRIGGE